MSAATRLGLVVHPDKPEAAALAASLTAMCGDRGLHAHIIDLEKGLPHDIDVVVGIGGDGTLLQAAGVAGPADVPLIGINLGRVGYLADVEPDNIDALLDGIVRKNLKVDHRMTIVAEADGHAPATGINDIVIEKVLSQRLVQIGVEINGRYFTTYRADGIIVATPLGSTAYSLSAGGPVVDPDLDALIMTPVAPHSLLSRTIMLSPDAVVEFSVELDRQARVNVDGRDAMVLEAGARLTVRRGERPVRFLSLGSHPFPQAVRRQFGLDHA